MQVAKSTIPVLVAAQDANDSIIYDTTTGLLISDRWWL